MRYQAELVDEFGGNFGLTVFECDDVLVRTGRSLFGDGLYVGRGDPRPFADVRLTSARWTRLGDWLPESGARLSTWVVEVVPPAPQPCVPPPGPVHTQRRHSRGGYSGGVPSRPFVVRNEGHSVFSCVGLRLRVFPPPGRVRSPTPLSKDPVTAGSIYDGKCNLAALLDTDG